MENEKLIIENENLLSDIDAFFLEFINLIKPFTENDKVTEGFYNYVAEMYDVFKKYKSKRQKENGLLYIRGIGRSIGRYEDWSGSGKIPWRVVDLYVSLIDQYIEKLQHLPEHKNT